jgi:dihydrofolate reductase
MRLTVQMFQSLDGVIQGPGGPGEDNRDGFTHGGWQFPLAGEEDGAAIVEWFGRADAFLLGHYTYDIWVGHWPRFTDPGDPIAGPLNALPKYVVTSEPITPEWAGTERIGGDLANEIAGLKARPGRELQVHGSAKLVRSLLALGAVDELRLFTYPVVLGSGHRLFEPGTTPTALEVLELRTTPTGSVIARYAPAGAPTYGSFAQPEDA